MSDENTDQKISLNSYGRKTWNVEKFAEEARNKARSTIEEVENEITGPSTSKELLNNRNEALHAIEGVKKVSLIAANAVTVSKRGRSAGFYCEVCDLTFKDDLQFVDHINSKQHLTKAGLSGQVKSASLEEVQKRLEFLKKKRDSEMMDEQFDIKKRIESRRQFEENLAKKKREKRSRLKEKRAKNDDVGNDDMMNMMGFKGFGTTKI